MVGMKGRTERGREQAAHEGAARLMDFLDAVRAEGRAHGIEVEVGRVTASYVELRIGNETPRSWLVISPRVRERFTAEEYKEYWDNELKPQLFDTSGVGHSVTEWPFIDAFLARIKPAGYTGEHGGTVGDETAILHAASDLLSRIYPRERVEKALGDLAAAERETTGRAKATPRPDWVEARKQPGKVADLLAQFIRAKFADELADGTMSTQQLYRYGGLHRAFYNHKDKLPPDLQDMPTRSEVNDRMVAEGKVKPARPPQPPDMKAYDRGMGQVRRARQRGAIPA
jgi:hypothetical protein